MIYNMLSGGEIPQTGVQWLQGFLVVLGLAAVVIGFIASLKALLKSSEKAYESRLEKEKGEMRRDIEIDTTLKGMKDSIDRLNDSISHMRGEIGSRVEKIEEQVERQGKQLVRIGAAVSSAHKRMDEHRKVDHNMNGTTRQTIESVEDAYEDNDEEGRY